MTLRDLSPTSSPAERCSIGNGPTWVHFWGDPLPDDEAAARNRLGSKALSLALLTESGLQTPPAFTIGSDACRQYLADGNLPEGVWSEVRAALARLESAAGRTFGKAPRPLTVAVRGGGAESLPGMLATFLHCGLTEKLAEEIGGEATWEAFAEFLDGHAPVCLGRSRAARLAKELPHTSAQLKCQRWLQELATSSAGPLSDDPEVILRSAIAAVFDSWESDEARRLRDRQGLDSSAGTSVTIQVMFKAAISGVVFSRDPSEPLADELIVEAVQGSGRRLLGGNETPLRWTINRRTLATVCGEGTADVAACAEFVARGLPQLCRDVLALEARLGQAVDVEFGYAGGKTVFFQARPLKGPLEQASIDRVRAAERARLVAWAKEGKKLWVRHNLAETLPAPTPLSWDLWRAFMTGEGGFGRLYRRLGYRPSRRVRRHGFLELIAGRVYADPQRLPEMLCAGYPYTFDPDTLRRDPDAIHRPPDRLDLEQLDPWFLLRWPWVVSTVLRAAWRQRSLQRNAIEEFERRSIPRIRSLVESDRDADLNHMSLADLIETFKRRRKTIFDDIAPACLLPGMLGAAAWNRLEHRLVKARTESEGRRTASAILSAITDRVTDRQQTLLRGVAEGQIRVDAFLEEFGHRGPGEMDLSSPRWRETPQAVLSLARRIKGGSTAVEEPVAEPRQLLAAAGESADLAPLLDECLAFLPYREIGKHEFMRAYLLLREVLLELSRRTGYGEGIHFLALAELENLQTQPDFEPVIAARRDDYRACRRLYVPAVLEVGSDMENFGLPPRFAAGQVLSGKSLVRGQAIGRVLLFDDQRPEELAGERVVVASSIEPAHVPLLADAAALVVERGGILSHVALLARQLAIPMIVVEGVTSQVVEGEPVLVDADRGLIERAENVA